MIGNVMCNEVKTVPVQKAYDDLLGRTLSQIPCDLSRLIYLASTRDYNTGDYHHAGLSTLFSLDGGKQALESAHRQIFSNLCTTSVKGLVEELEIYLRFSHAGADDVLRAWEELEPYRIAVPMHTDPTAANLFLSNVRFAVAILRRCRRKGQGPQSKQVA